MIKIILIFIGLKLMEFVGILAIIGALLGICFLMSEYLIFKYVICSLMLIFVIVVMFPVLRDAVEDNWEWAKRLAKRT